MQCSLKVNPLTLPSPHLTPTKPMRVNVVLPYRKVRRVASAWTPVVEEKVLSMRRHGLSYRKIGEEFGKSETWVRYHLKRMRERGEL